MSFIKFHPVKRILVGQWNDNKVLYFILSFEIFEITSVQHHVGANKCDFLIHKSLKWYAMDNFMGGVDNIEKYNNVGGSFTSCDMFIFVF